MTEKFDPMREIINLKDNLSRAVEKGLRSVSSTGTFPAMDVYETGDHIIARTEPLVGLITGSIQVSVEDDVLRLSGTTKSYVSEDDVRFLQRELRFGDFVREIRLPLHVDASKAKASLKSGTVTIKLPKKLLTEDSQIIAVTPVD